MKTRRQKGWDALFKSPRTEDTDELDRLKIPSQLACNDKGFVAHTTRALIGAQSVLRGED
ncbi:MAG: hypothetical protein A2Y76_06195 [Planctomycetes bacterium RBG_13_60_9]|nr:MAG: hypothetical protein A2Y76_06195 [Planctomycetes bacterium RBG_13_60_9]